MGDDRTLEVIIRAQNDTNRAFAEVQGQMAALTTQVAASDAAMRTFALSGMGPLIAAVVVLTAAMAPLLFALAGIAVIGGAFFGLTALVAGLASTTPAGAAAIKGFTDQVMGMVHALGVQATPILIVIIKWFEQFIPTIQKAGSELLSWFGERLPAMLPIMKTFFEGAGNAIKDVATIAGNVVDWFIKNWPQISKVAGDEWNALKQIFNNPNVQEGIKEIKKIFGDVVAHLNDLKPLLPAVGAAIVAMALVVEGGIGGLLLLARTLEAIVAAGGWIIDNGSRVGGAMTGGGGGGKFGGGQPRGLSPYGAPNPLYLRGLDGTLGT
ncbi:MAG: hypothetical protein M3082_06490 [Candidatus Dormibacteraeota bacterium]|nr:hypothetical protein [Candidatus Dormibacteraeota bacterium]